MSRKRNVDHYGTVELVEIQNVKVFNEKFSKELELFRQGFNLLAETCIDIYNKLRHTKEPILVRDFVILMFSSKFLLSSKALLNLVLNGYEYEAKILMRSMLEQLLLCEGFLKEEGLVDKWLKGKLSISEVKCVVQEVSLDENFRWLYETLSDYVHTNPPGLGEQIKVLDEGEGLSVKIAPVIPDSTEDQVDILHFPTCYIILYLIILKNAYEEKIDIETKERVSRFIEQMLTYFTRIYSASSTKQNK